MGSAVPIVEILGDGRYQLNEEVLTSIVSMADNCQNCAVISTFGSKQNFLLNFLISYSDSHNKTNWLTNEFINNYRFKGDGQQRPSIMIWSEPLIVKDEDQNSETAVFLMNSSNVFNDQTDDKQEKLMEDIINLFCFTSSTIIFSEVNGLSKTNLKTIENSFGSVLFENNMKTFEEVLHLVFDWDPKQTNYTFGFKGGNSYMNNEFDVDLSQYFSKNRCYLLPSTGVNTNDTVLNLKEMNQNFIIEFKKLIKNELLNIDEMQIKKCIDSDQYLKPKQLVPLFRKTVQQLNERQTYRTEDQKKNNYLEGSPRARTISNISKESIEVIESSDQRSDSESNADAEELKLDESSHQPNKQQLRADIKDESFEILDGSDDKDNEDQNDDRSSVGTASEKDNKELYSELSSDSEETNVSDNKFVAIDIQDGEDNDGCIENVGNVIIGHQNCPEVDQLAEGIQSINLNTKSTTYSSVDETEEFLSLSQENADNLNLNQEQFETHIGIMKGQSYLNSNATNDYNIKKIEEPVPKKTTESTLETDFNDLLEKLKIYHYKELMSFLDTKKFVSTDTITNKHQYLENQLKTDLFSKFENQDNETENKIIVKFESVLKNNYCLVVEESERRKDVAFTENYDSLFWTFCDKVREHLKSHMMTKDTLENHFQYYQSQIQELLNIRVGQYDPLLAGNILAKVLKELETCKEGFRRQRIEKWIDSMEEFNENLMQVYYTPLDKYLLEKRFNSIQEFAQLLSFRRQAIMKQFDFKYNINDEFDDQYKEKREQLLTKLDQMNSQLSFDYNLRQEFEKKFEQLVVEYDKSMMALIHTKIKNQMTDILSLKFNAKEFNEFHIKSKDKIFEAFDNRVHIIEKKSYKFPESFEKKLFDVLEQKKNNFQQIINNIEHYLNDWFNSLNEKPYIVNIDNYNRVVIQRRKLLNEMLQIKDNALKLFEQIFPAIKLINENKQQLFRESYEKLLKQSVDFYENNMRQSIESRLKLFNYDMDLNAVHNQKSTETHDFFRAEAKKFDTINDENSTEFKTKLTKILNSKKEKFQSALGQINNYRSKWINKMDQTRIFSNEKLIELNEEIHKQFQKTGDQKLDSILFKQMDKIFNEIQEKNEEIKSREETIGNQVLDITLQSFQQTFDNKLKSGFYKGFEVELMFNKLLDYTKTIFNRRCDFNEYQNILKIQSLYQLDSKLRLYSKEAFSLHSRKSVYATNIIKQSIDTSVAVYKDWINGLVSSDRRLKPNEFQNESKLMKEQTFNNILVDWQSFRDYFIEDFYRKLLTDTRNEINQKFNEMEKSFTEKYLSKEASIAIYFARKSLYSVHKEQDLTDIERSGGITILPNCIAIDNKIMVGTEALNYYINSDQEHFKGFDIKSLLTKTFNDKKEIQKILTPFDVNYENKVKVTKNGKLCEFTVEALMALQVLEIKSKYEKNLNAIVDSAIFTLPTHFDIRQKNSMKDVAKIAGIKSIEIMTEITAAAINYANDLKINGKLIINDVLFIAINDNKCDAAICQIDNNQIKYKSHFQCEFNDNDMNNIRSSRNTNNYYQKSKNCFKDIFLKIFEKKQFPVSGIENIVVIGSSDLIPDLKYYIKKSEKFDKKYVDKIIYKCDPLEIVAIGTALYNQRKSFDITEVPLYQIGYQIESRYKKLTGITEFIKPNKRIPAFETKNLGLITEYKNFPFSVVIYQNNRIVDIYRIMPLNETFFNANYNVIQYFNHEVTIRSDGNGHLSVQSRIFSPDNKTSIELDVRHSRLGLNSQEIQEQANKIKQLVLNVQNNMSVQLCESRVPRNEPNPLQDPTQVIDTETDCLRLELKTYYEDIKQRTENNNTLRQFIRENIEQQLSETLAVIESKESNKQKFIAHKGFLEKFERFLK